MRARDERPDYAAELCRELVDVPAVLAALDLKAKREGSGYKVLCPWHGERSASCMVRSGPDRTLQAKCHGCGRGGDVLSLIAAVRGYPMPGSFRDVLREAAQMANRWDIVDDIDGRASGEPRPPREPRPAPSPAAPERTYAPTDEVAALWEACAPTEADAEVSAWLRSRALDPADVDASALARALPADGLPRWARYRGAREQSAPWSETGHRCAFPLFDALGELRGVRARLVRGGDDPKALPPSGFKVSGLVLADRAAQVMLATGELSGGRLVVAEGEPDFLTFASSVSDADEHPAAVIGIPGSGSWVDDIGARVPSGTKVAIWTHHDANGTGEKYAKAVAASLAGRCKLLRGT